MAYRAFDLELVNDRNTAKELIFDYNHSRPSETDKKQEIIRSLFGKTSKSFLIEAPFHCDYGYNIQIGKHFYANYNCVMLDCAPITIGNNVLFGPNVSLYTAIHPIHPIPRNQLLEFAFPITIKDNVWIGGSVVINQGVTIGENTVIGSGSVVTRDIPANVIAVGNPCRVLRAVTESDRVI